jgi:hypothetical protein
VSCNTSKETGKVDGNRKIYELIIKEINPSIQNAKDAVIKHFGNFVDADEKLCIEIFNSPRFSNLEKKMKNKIFSEIEALQLNDNEIENILKCIETENFTKKRCEYSIGKVMGPTSTIILEYGDKISGEFIADLINNGKLSIKIDSSTCKKYHEGQFYFKTEQGEKINITRTSSNQFEKFKNLNFEYKVNWIDECTYQLSSISKGDSKISIAKIIEETDSGYKFISYSKIDNEIIIGNSGVFSKTNN